MRILLKIVYRNLKEHKVKTLIIGFIITFGIFILTIGNSVIDTVTAGISKNFVDNYTGHIAVFPASLEEPSLMGMGPGAMTGDAVTPVIDDFSQVIEYVRSNPAVRSVSPQIFGMATMQFDEEGTGFAQLLAVEPELYNQFFPGNIQLLEGEFLKPGQEGIVLSQFAAEMLEESSGETVDIGDSVLLTSMNQIFGMKIREVPVVGIYDVTVAMQAMTSFVDGENMRVLSGMTQITDIEALLSEAERAALGAVDEAALFGGDDILVAETDIERGRNVEDNVLFANTSGTQESGNINEIDPNTWHYLLVKLDDESMINRTAKDLNTGFEEQGLPVKAYSWIEVAGQVAEMTTAIRIVFNIIILIIAVVAVIIIMNTLVISVTERIAEIGTMRAIGAQKGFVRKMIIFETLIITLFFGAVGLASGTLAILIVRAANIETANMILQMLAGGSVIKPIVSAGSILISLFGIVAAGMLASLYPASLALRIQPRQAMAS